MNLNCHNLVPVVNAVLLLTSLLSWTCQYSDFKSKVENYWTTARESMVSSMEVRDTSPSG